MLCNEPFGWWQTYVQYTYLNISAQLTNIYRGPPSSYSENHSPLVSRIASAEYYQRQCPLYFPPVNGHTYGIGKNGEKKTYSQENSWTHGWGQRNSSRLLWING